MLTSGGESVEQHASLLEAGYSPAARRAPPPRSAAGCGCRSAGDPPGDQVRDVGGTYGGVGAYRPHGMNRGSSRAVRPRPIPAWCAFAGIALRYHRRGSGRRGVAAHPAVASRAHRRDAQSSGRIGPRRRRSPMSTATAPRDRVRASRRQSASPQCGDRHEYRGWRSATVVGGALIDSACGGDLDNDGHNEIVVDVGSTVARTAASSSSITRAAAPPLPNW